MSIYWLWSEIMNKRKTNQGKKEAVKTDIEIKKSIDEKYNEIDQLYKTIQNKQDQITNLEHCLKYGFDKGC